MRKFSCVNNKRAFAIFLFCTSLAIISQAQTLTTLANFNGTKGAAPSALVQGTDGNFYGTTQSGATGGDGTVFKITAGGTLTTLNSFCTQGICASDEAPNGLIQASDGNFYGTTQGGGAIQEGTVFKVTPGGALTTLYSFTDGADGGTRLVISFKLPTGTSMEPPSSGQTARERSSRSSQGAR